jgi:translocation and assembly module TamA
MAFSIDMKKTIITLSSLLLSLAVFAAEPIITIKGGTKKLRENIRLHLTLVNENCAAPQWRLNALLNHAQQEIDTAAQALGYYELEYDAEFIHEDDCWGLRMDLRPGDPVLIDELRIDIRGDGGSTGEFKALDENPGLIIGKRFDHGHYASLKARIEQIAVARGYFAARFESAKAAVNVAKKTVAIELIYDTGPRYSIGDITIESEYLHHDFLRRYLTFKEGDYYDTEQLLELKNLYNASNYFSVVSVSPRLQGLKEIIQHPQVSNPQVPIDVQLEAHKRHEYSIGLGAATDTGPRVKLGYDNRYVNRHGHRFSAETSVSKSDSTEKNSTLTTYTLPMDRPAFEFLRLYAGYEKDIKEGTSSRKHIYGSSYSYYQSNKWLQTYALDFVTETSVIGDMPETHPDLLIPSLAITRTKTDAAPYTLEGWTLLAKLSGSPESLGSSFSYIQFYARAKYIQSFSQGNDYLGRIVLRTELGATETKNIPELPASVRFFAGGDASVRGYAYQSLGPVDDQNNTIGGKNLLVSSIEYDYLFPKSRWALAAFYDQGNASDDTEFDQFAGAGLGVRWISPIGPVRVDVAKALDGDEGWRLHVSMGPDL